MHDDPRTLSKLCVLLISFTCNSMAFSITPYFTPYAHHELGIDESLIGLIFSSFPVGYMILTAVMGLFNIAHLKISTVSTGWRVAVLAFGAFTTLFALTPTMLRGRLQHDYPPSTYVALFCTFRLLEGACVAVMDVLVLVYLTKMYPDAVSEVLGEKEACVGLGVVLGPPLGGALYHLGGFCLPPMATGGLVVASTILAHLTSTLRDDVRAVHSWRFVPREWVVAATEGRLLHAEDMAAFRVKELQLAGEQVELTLAHFRRLVRLPAYAAVGPMVLFMVAVAYFAFVEAMLPLYYKDAFGTTPWAFGLCLGSVALAYSIAAVFSGKYFNKERHAVRPHVCVLGSVFQAIFLFFLAPSFDVILGRPVSDRRTGFLPLSIVALIGGGFCFAIPTVVGTALVVDTATVADQKLLPAVSAAVSFSASLGGAIGPLVGSALVGCFGFSMACFVFCCAGVLIAALYWSLYTLSCPRTSSGSSSFVVNAAPEDVDTKSPLLVEA
jgi:MFS family permease